MSNEQIKMIPEEIYGPDMTEMLNEPFEPIFCIVCHEHEVSKKGEVCSCCQCGEL